MRVKTHRDKMTNEEQTVLIIKGLISELPAEQREACYALIVDVKHLTADAGEPMATLVLALLGAEAQAKA